MKEASTPKNLDYEIEYEIQEPIQKKLKYNIKLAFSKMPRRAIFFFIVWGVVRAWVSYAGLHVSSYLIGARPTRGAYARNMLLTCTYAGLRGKHRQSTWAYAPILHRLAYAEITQTYALTSHISP